jgi:steroid 5-alpha reductase family enzyme
MDIIVVAFVVSLVINLLMFVPAYIYKTDKVTDISYAITFATVAVAAYLASTHTSLHKTILVLVLLWSFRLGAFLFIRINKIGKDSRFDGMREHFFLFLKFWLAQGITVFIVMIAPLMGFIQNDTRVTTLTLIGVGVFLSGLLIETFADMQKFKFSNNSKHKSIWIDEGIWRVSRHPNYLGEILVWTGVFVTVASSVTSFAVLAALISPLFIAGLLCFVSGIPLLEKIADKKWGNDKNYQLYKKRVPVLLPTIQSLKRFLQ